MEKGELVYPLLKSGIGIPTMHLYMQQDDYRILILELLGPTLADLLIYCDGQFSLRVVLLLADQLLRRLRFIHSKGCIHRDLKPGNIALSTGKMEIDSICSISVV